MQYELTTTAQEKNRVAIYIRPTSLEEEGYCPNFARITVTGEDLARILDLQKAITALDVSEIRDRNKGHLVEWFGGSQKSECDEMVVTKSDVYWAALPPEFGSQFETPGFPITALQEVLDRGVDNLFISMDDIDKADAEAAYTEYLNRSRI
jgi:hypothetical protein